jgi:hypothetical protein
MTFSGAQARQTRLYTGGTPVRPGLGQPARACFWSPIPAAAVILSGAKDPSARFRPTAPRWILHFVQDDKRERNPKSSQRGALLKEPVEADTRQHRKISAENTISVGTPDRLLLVLEAEDNLVGAGVVELEADHLFDIRPVGPQPFQNFFLIAQTGFDLDEPPLALRLDLAEAVVFRPRLPKENTRRQAEAEEQHKIKADDDATHGDVMGRRRSTTPARRE